MKDLILNNRDRIGAYTYGAENLKIKSWGNETSNKKLVVGKFCSLAGNIQVYLGGNHRTNLVTTYPFGSRHTNVFNRCKPWTGISKGDVIIGNDVWISENVVIMSGVTIGDGAVIANNSHVVKDVEPYSIVGGNPAKLIRYRFTTDQIKKLLEIKWWYWDDEKINKYSPLLCNENIDYFIKTAIYQKLE